MNAYELENRKIQVEEYLKLRGSTNWHPVSREQVDEALVNDLFSVCVTCEQELVGMGRVIGDNALYFYIQDVIVLPEHKGKGVGRIIMKSIEDYLANSAGSGAFIGLMAAEGTKTDELDRVYRAVLVEVICLSHAVAAPAGEIEHAWA